MSNELQKEALACRALLLIWRSNEMNHEFAKALDGRLAFPHDQQPINMLDEFFRKSRTIVLLQLETSLPSSLVCCHRSLACFENLCERRLAEGHGRSPTLVLLAQDRSRNVFALAFWRESGQAPKSVLSDHPLFPFLSAPHPLVQHGVAAMDREESPSPSTPTGGSDSSSGGTKFGDGMLVPINNPRSSQITI